METDDINRRKFMVPTKNELRQAVISFSKSKKEWGLFLFLVGILFLSTILILQKINLSFMIKIPGSGGEIVEGIIGTPRFANPILSPAGADKDLTTLIYSGLMKKNSDNKLETDLAEKYTISEDGLSYTFILRDNIFFHDNKPITAQDIVFTINQTKDPNISQGVEKIRWEGVSVKKINDKTIQFNLEKPFTPFLNSTTLGILPYHLWKDIPPEQFDLSDLNLNGVGSGPYKIKKIKKKKTSGMISYYKLVPFKKYINHKSLVKKLVLKFYPSEEDLIEAFKNKEINQIGGAISPAKLESLNIRKNRIELMTFRQIFGLFLNKNKTKIFTDQSTIEAFDLAIDKRRIIKEILYGYGEIIDGPTSPNLIVVDSLEMRDNKIAEEELYSATEAIKNTEKAKEILKKNGWKINQGENVLEKKINDEIVKLKFSISIDDESIELKEIANLIKGDLEKIGAKVEIKIFKTGDLRQNVIRNREYEALLIGQKIGHESDLYNFWHSSQIGDETIGLNITAYANLKVNELLSEARTSPTLTENERAKKYLEAVEEIKKERPAIFIYSPNFVYLVKKNLMGINVEQITNLSDRFTNINNWYLETDKIWRIFKSY